MDDPLATQDFEMVLPPSPSQAPDSSQPVPRTDLVEWQSTQPLPALDALLKQSAVSRSARRASYSTSPSTFFFPDGLSSPDASSSRSASASTSTISRRSTSKVLASRRARSRHSDSSFNPAPTGSPFTLSHSFVTGNGGSSFVDILKSVSKAIDENARIKKRHLDKRSSRIASGEFQARRARIETKINPSREELIDRTNVGLQKRRGSVKGKERMRVVDAAIPMEMDRSFSALDVDISTSQTRPTGEVNIQVMTSSADRMPPPPVPAKVSNRPTKVHQPPGSSTSAARPHSSPPVVVTPALTSAHAHALASSSSQAVPTSSFSRPPALGMRRTANLGGNLFAHSQKVLPSKQKGFKPPLTKSSTGPALVIPYQTQRPSAYNSNDIRTSGAGPFSTQMSLHGTSTSQDSSSHHLQGSPTDATNSVSKPILTPAMGEEADSSYGELSFDMDILEEAMKEYDE